MVAKTLNELLTICKSVNFADEKVQQLGPFYKAASYIIYRGEDEKRNWNDFADYSKAEEKEQVDQICYKINNSINQDSAYVLKRYFTEDEAEGKWHVMVILYTRKGQERLSVFAFLKIGERFGLGDID